MTHAFNASDHGALLSTISLTFLTYSFSSWLLRVYLRLRIYGPWGRDDTAATTATLLTVLQVVGTCIAVRFGLGKQSKLLDDRQLDAVEKGIYGLWLLYFAAICCSKCSSYLLVARLARDGHISKAAHVLTMISVAWGIISILLFSLNRYHADKWAQLFPQWLGLEIASMLLDLALIGLVIWLIWGHRMPWTMKATVVGTIGARSLIIPAVIYRLFILSRPPLDPIMGSVDSTLLLQCILHYSVIASTIPTAQSVIRPFQSGWSDLRARNLSYGTHAPKVKGPPRSSSPIALVSMPRASLPSSSDFEQGSSSSKKKSMLSWQRTQSSYDTSSGSTASRAFTMAEVGEADELFRPNTIGFSAVAEFGPDGRRKGSMLPEGSMIIKRTMSLDVTFEKVAPSPHESGNKKASSCSVMPEDWELPHGQALAPWPCETTDTASGSVSSSTV